MAAYELNMSSCLFYVALPWSTLLYVDPFMFSQCSHLRLLLLISQWNAIEKSSGKGGEKRHALFLLLQEKLLLEILENENVLHIKIPIA